ncbi:MAG: purine-nucleoside phosphorylase [Bacteroidales bacterium]|nr:purine-nucleoside phosphorylase [Bacteroidales bacterium]MDT8374231.1 purine-nucleoside phosphorylase [Bacteroidales bacterium]
MNEKIRQTVSYLESNGIKDPEIGIVLGTGLGKMVNLISIDQEINYEVIPNFEKSTVEFHSGKLISGTLGGKKVLAMQGRLHYYEGYSMQQITFPIRVMKAMGIKFLLLSNAAGAINPDYRKGSLMLVSDHINLLPENPLRGKNDESQGPRFPDMSCPYSQDLNKRLLVIAAKENIVLHSGVYASVQGPNLETRAEYRLLKVVGADAVGMSTVPEVIVANHIGLPCSAISVITDECDPEHLKPVDINDIIAVAGEAEKDLVRIYTKLIETL